MERFKDNCPLHLDELPSKPCELAKPVLNNLNRITNEPKCPWWINCEKSSFCFWKYVYRNSDVNGNLPELLQSDLANLFGCSTTKIHFMQKESLENLTNIIKGTGEVEDGIVDIETLQQQLIDFDSLLGVGGDDFDE